MYVHSPQVNQGHGATASVHTRAADHSRRVVGVSDTYIHVGVSFYTWCVGACWWACFDAAQVHVHEGRTDGFLFRRFRLVGVSERKRKYSQENTPENATSLLGCRSLGSIATLSFDVHRYTYVRANVRSSVT